MKKPAGRTEKGAAAGEKGSKVEGDMEDLGAPVVKGDEKSNPMLQRKSRKILLFLQTKGDEAPQKLKEEDESDEDEKDSDDEEHGRNGHMVTSHEKRKRKTL